MTRSPEVDNLKLVCNSVPLSSKLKADDGDPGAEAHERPKDKNGVKVIMPPEP